MKMVSVWVVLCLAIILPPVSANTQDNSRHSKPSDKQVAPEATPVKRDTADSQMVVLSGTATRARIADPNERVVFSGRVMRMADYVAAVSSSTEAVQRLRIQEMRNREKDQPTPPSKPSH